MGVVKVVLSVLFVVLVVAAAFIAGGLAGNRPPLSDPPGMWRRLQVYLTTHVAETAQDSEFPELRPRRFKGTPAEVLDAVAHTTRTFGWEPVTVDPQAGKLSAVVTSGLWKFKDDLVVTVEPDGDGHSIVNARSQSRIGRADLAANAYHVRELLGGVARRVPPANEDKSGG